MDNKTALLVLMIVLIVFVVMLAVLAIVFIIALRKRAPVVKVVMAPPSASQAPSASLDATPAVEGQPSVSQLPPPVMPSASAEPEEPEPEEADDDDEAPAFVTEGKESVRYDRSFTAKLAQLKNETKEWYSQLKNELLSYEKIKGRMSWRRESFRMGRMTVAKLGVRGKTLCLMLAVEPAGYGGSKYHVEDVSNVNSMAGTPTLYRIKSARRLKYAKEMLAGMMKELKAFKDPRYEPQDFFVPYEGDVSLMQRGLVRRIVSGSTRTFRIEEVETPADDASAEAAATSAEGGENSDK